MTLFETKKSDVRDIQKAKQEASELGIELPPEFLEHQETLMACRAMIENYAELRRKCPDNECRDAWDGRAESLPALNLLIQDAADESFSDGKTKEEIVKEMTLRLSKDFAGLQRPSFLARLGEPSSKFPAPEEFWRFGGIFEEWQRIRNRAMSLHKCS